jgi:4,5-dihydroxyphthalate decarboxylase
MTEDIHATLALGNYVHTADLMNGRLKVEGINLTTLRLPVLEVFHRFINYQEWEISEMSSAKYVSLLARGDSPFTAIPVFPSRMFRHAAFYVRPDGPSEPSELRGLKIGIPEWAQTAGVYGRGMLADEWGVGITEVEWIQAGVNQPGRGEKVALQLPDGVRYRSVRDKSLQDMLLSGEIDAIFTADNPTLVVAGDPRIKQMYPAPVAPEQDYFARTGVYPIMHLIALRKDFVEKYPWAPMNIFNAFEQAKNAAVEEMWDTGASAVPIPWYQWQMREAEKLMGWDHLSGDYWPYGVEKNRTTLETFLRWSYEQGVTARKLEVDEMFAPQMATRVKV